MERELSVGGDGDGFLDGERVETFNVLGQCVDEIRRLMLLNKCSVFVLLGVARDQ